MLRAYGVTDKGRIRPTNEDCFAIHDDIGLCVVADGMGGHNAGEVAARLAVDAVVDYCAAALSGPQFAGEPVGRDLQSRRWPFGFDPELSADGNLLRTAIQLANVQILEAAGTADRYSGMGTTIVAVRVDRRRVVVGHVGDSRLYILTSGSLRQVTHDDSWVASMLAQDPQADPVMLQQHPLRNALTNVVGARPRTDVHVLEEELRDGDLLLLTTDGVHGVLSDEQLTRVVTAEPEPKAAAREVLMAALARGSRDNCTVIAARYEAD